MVERNHCEICNGAGEPCQTYGPFDSLCEICIDDLQIRDDFDRAVVKLAALARRDPEAALNTWSEFYEINRHRARGDWLRLTVAYYRADVLLLQQRWADAELQLRGLLGQVEKHSDLHRSIVTSMASALEGLGRTREAIGVLRDLVIGSPDMSDEDTLGTLYTCAMIAKRNHAEVPEELWIPFDAAASRYGVATEASENEPTSLIAMIEAAHRLRLAAQDRYTRVLDDLRTKAPSARRECLIQYAQGEPVIFFRNMALTYAHQDGRQE